MAFAVSAYSSGRASFAAISPLRSTVPDRKSPGSLDPEDESVLHDLRARDREVRAQETAHRAAAGRYAGATSYTYAKGPDGLPYAVEGDTQIDAKPVPGDPQATVEKMKTIRAAALVPVTKSAADLALDRQALWHIALARAEIREADDRARAEIEQNRNARRFEASRAADAYTQLTTFMRLYAHESDYLT